MKYKVRKKKKRMIYGWIERRYIRVKEWKILRYRWIEKIIY